MHLPPDGSDAMRMVWPLRDAVSCGDGHTGAVWDAAAAECVSLFLRHAVEVMRDGAGNENLLCESGETCVFSPNIGAYQGHGELEFLAQIAAGGMVENVTLLRYTVNGR